MICQTYFAHYHVHRWKRRQCCIKIVIRRWIEHARLHKVTFITNYGFVGGARTMPWMGRGSHTGGGGVLVSQAFYCRVRKKPSKITIITQNNYIITYKHLHLSIELNVRQRMHLYRSHTYALTCATHFQVDAEDGVWARRVFVHQGVSHGAVPPAAIHQGLTLRHVVYRVHGQVPCVHPALRVLFQLVTVRKKTTTKNSLSPCSIVWPSRLCNNLITMATCTVLSALYSYNSAKSFGSHHVRWLGYLMFWPMSVSYHCILHTDVLMLRRVKDTTNL